MTDIVERSRIQTLALRSGGFFQNLGALLLELGRTTMTLQMGQTPVCLLVLSGIDYYFVSFLFFTTWSVAEICFYSTGNYQNFTDGFKT